MHWLPSLLILPYTFFLLKTYRSLLHVGTFNISADPATFVSIVVACRNEQKNLPALLNSIALQNYPEYLFEVIIVNDRSTDNTFEIAAGFTGISNIHTLNNKGEGKKHALRTGIKSTKGNLIITTDADCRKGKNWIRTIEAYFNHSGNLHDEINSGDDIFLLHSIKKENGSKILWLESPDTLVTTASSSTFRSFVKQRGRWISKGKAYKDNHTIVLGIVTFVTISMLMAYLFASLIYPDLIWVFILMLILKSVPDFLILQNTCKRYSKRNLMRWFLPAQLIYPFYLLSVAFYSLIFRENRNINSPFPKEI